MDKIFLAKVGLGLDARSFYPLVAVGYGKSLVNANHFIWLHFSVVKTSLAARNQQRSFRVSSSNEKISSA